MQVFLRVQGLGYYLSYNIKAPGVFNSSLFLPLPLPLPLRPELCNIEQLTELSILYDMIAAIP